jgi:DNA-binding Lrp family transcriptional regulator
MAFDKTDKAILLELDLNARKTNKGIARKLKTSEAIVAYRIKRMSESGLIDCFYTMVNGARFGLLYFRIYIRLQNIDLKAEKELIGSFTANPYTSWIVSVRGRYDLVVSMYAKSVEQFSAELNRITKNFDSYILSKSISIVEEAQAYARTHLRGGEGKEIKLLYGGSPKKSETTGKDYELLKKISKRGRMPIAGMARLLKTNGEAIRYRIKKLKEQKVILGFRVLPNLKLAGYQQYIISLSLHSLTRPDERRLANFCLRHPNILFYVKCIGSHEADLEIEVENEEKFDSLFNELKGYFPKIIRDYEILSISQQHKFDYFSLGDRINE